MKSEDLEVWMVQHWGKRTAFAVKFSLAGLAGGALVGLYIFLGTVVSTFLPTTGDSAVDLVNGMLLLLMVIVIPAVVWVGAQQAWENFQKKYPAQDKEREHRLAEYTDGELAEMAEVVYGRKSDKTN